MIKDEEEDELIVTKDVLLNKLMMIKDEEDDELIVSKDVLLNKLTLTRYD
jgi:uncharacterized protein YaiI (UPF0178 family)